MWKPITDMNWQRDGICAPMSNSYIKYKDYFFSNDQEDIMVAKQICSQCPVRQECLQYALEHRKIHGVWGGRSCRELRWALSVDHKGDEIRRRKFPYCPNCGVDASNLDTGTADLPNGGRWTTARIVYCTQCKFSWRSRTSVNAVNAYRLYVAQQRKPISED